MAQFVFSAFADEAGNTLDAQIAALRRNGIRCIEPRAVNGKGILAQTDEELCEIRRRLDDAGITVPSLGSPIGKYPIAEDFGPHLEDFRRALKVCRVLGAPRMRMFSFFVGQDELAARRDEVLRRMSIMLDEAEEAGILLCHENESKIYGQNPEEVEDLLRSLPRLRGIFDPANYVTNGCDPVRGIDVTLPSLEYMHIKDALFGESYTIVPAGEGDGKIADALRKVDAARDGVVYLTLEPHLKIFGAFASIDEHELKGKYDFRTSDEAFDFAVRSLENVLRSLGFEKGENATWKK